MAPAGAEHGGVANKLAYFLTAHVIANNLGQVFAAETGFRLSRSPDTVRAADAAFVRADRIPPGGPPAGYFEGAPDLAVEVVSPGDTVQEVEDKVDDYLAAGARMVWVVNPRRRTVTGHRPGVNPVVLREGDFLDGHDVVPGFRCAVREVFA
jgi:Uma2 family endonuclease